MRRAAWLLAPVMVTLSACHRTRPEDQVKAAYQACCEAIASGDAAGAVEALSPRFRGPEGMDRASARLYLTGLLQRQKVGITTLRNDVRVEGDEATQDVSLLLTDAGGGLLPSEASRRTFLLTWRREGRAWKLVELEAPDGL